MRKVDLINKFILPHYDTLHTCLLYTSQPVYTADIGNSMANVVELKQTYTRNHFTHTPADYVRADHLHADYTRTLADNGSSILCTLGAEHISDNEMCIRDRNRV